METLRKLLKHPEFTAVLLLCCTALFGWPFISIPGPSSPAAMFVYLFLVWGAVIALLWLLAKACGDPSVENNSECGD